MEPGKGSRGRLVDGESPTAFAACAAGDPDGTRTEVRRPPTLLLRLISDTLCKIDTVAWLSPRYRCISTTKFPNDGHSTPRGHAERPFAHPGSECLLHLRCGDGGRLRLVPAVLRCRWRAGGQRLRLGVETGGDCGSCRRCRWRAGGQRLRARAGGAGGVLVGSSCGSGPALTPRAPGALVESKSLG
jgi:hypothetical protein